ncbi:response regulator transcription factor [Enterococcus olivae]
MNILVIDDDLDLLQLIKRALESAYQVTTEDQAKTVDPNSLKYFDLILLDVMMPEMSGFEFLRLYREMIDVPVLFLTAKDFEEDKLEGFASGGDDYITKPFSIKELRARVDAHLRREKREKRQRLIDEEISCDLIAKTFYIREEVLELTPSEYELCLLLLRHKGQVFSKESIYGSIYGIDALGDSHTTITERVKQIRSKFQKEQINPIQTVWGVGYKWKVVHL